MVVVVVVVAVVVVVVVVSGNAATGTSWQGRARVGRVGSFRLKGPTRAQRDTAHARIVYLNVGNFRAKHPVGRSALAPIFIVNAVQERIDRGARVAGLVGVAWAGVRMREVGCLALSRVSQRAE